MGRDHARRTLAVGAILAVGAMLATATAFGARPEGAAADLRHASSDGVGSPNGARGPARTVIVLLSDQADTSSAYRLAGKEARGRYVYEQLRAAADRSQSPIVSWLRAQGASVQAFTVVNALAVTADDWTLSQLERLPGVAAVRAEGSVRLIEPVPPDGLEPSRGPRGMDAGGLLSLQAPLATEPGIRDIGADDVWRMGFEGDEIVVAITDTGAAYKHPALKNVYRGIDTGSDYNWLDAVGDEPEPVDEHGHGTHVTGTIAGKAGSRMIGVAPEARWIACRMIRERSGPDAAALQCLDWVLAPTRVDGSEPRPDLAPDIVNASWGGDKEDCEGSPSLQRAVANLRAAGILFVTSAGNNGNACSTICAPGAFPESFTVANYDARTRRIADSSSRGPVVTADGESMKPDVAAPGENINSSVPPSRYGELSGTSMAAPHVSGAAALLLDARPELRGRPEVLREILMSTSRAIRADRCGPDADEGPNYSAGYGAIDVAAAVVLALTATPPPTPSVTPTKTVGPSPTRAATRTRVPTATRTATPERPAGHEVFLPSLMR